MVDADSKAVSEKSKDSDAEDSHIQAVTERHGNRAFNFSLIAAACASETVGSRTTARELVIADGKKR